MDGIFLQTVDISQKNKSLLSVFLVESDWILHCFAADVHRCLTDRVLNTVDVDFKIVESGCRVSSIFNKEPLINLDRLNYRAYCYISLAISSILISLPYDIHIDGIYRNFIKYMYQSTTNTSEFLQLKYTITYHLMLLGKSGYGLDWSCRQCSDETYRLSIPDLICEKCKDDNIPSNTADVYRLYETLTGRKKLSTVGGFHLNIYKTLLRYILIQFLDSYGVMPYHEWLL